MFTDEACIGNAGPGGYGVVVLQGEYRTELSGGFRVTTNNRMELMAAIAGLEPLDRMSTVRVYTDSKYVQEGISRGWARSWRASGWRKEKGKRTNSDLWDRLLKNVITIMLNLFGSRDTPVTDRMSVAIG